MMDISSFTSFFTKLIAILVIFICPLIAITYLPQIDLTWLKANSLNLIATSGTMATISLAFLFEKIVSSILHIWMRLLATVSILLFLVASFTGLSVNSLPLASDSPIYQLCYQTLFWFTVFGIVCLILILLTMFFSDEREVILA